jgi:hypothetical protein
MSHVRRVNVYMRSALGNERLDSIRRQGLAYISLGSQNMGELGGDLMHLGDHKT